MFLQVKEKLEHQEYSMLPIHPHPYEDELLSSWMIRLSFSNGYLPHTFYSKVLLYKQSIWNVDIDRHQPEGLLELLEKQSGQSIEKLKRLTLNNYLGYLFDSVTINGNSRWIMPLGIYHREHKRPGLQFCPRCLEEKIYYRRHWRLSLFAMCERHDCVLYDKCPRCLSLIMFHRIGTGKKKSLFPVFGVEVCYNCFFNFKEAPSIVHDDFESGLIDNYIELITNFKANRWAVPGYSLPCSISFYSGLYFIVSAVLGRRGHLARVRIKRELGVDLLFVEEMKDWSLDYLDCHKRIKVLTFVSWVIQDWPTRFVRFCTKTGITRSSFSDHINELPFWLYEVINTELELRPYIPTQTEMVCAGEYIKKRIFLL
ncbi:TniQ family protein [Microbulbifer sp. VAAF005]|uniref:TniQ family protein n=1 Tax=Microbulbifer sp. VAAF005 TaxID=3034230 RepID=UPI0024AE4030|nr:TniQ family protein [Microbulbifer sp. VAAF005]WHI49084.1 TniQ family protein [Microbulbifer sp. VAAF005]